MLTCQLEQKGICHSIANSSLGLIGTWNMGAGESYNHGGSFINRNIVMMNCKKLRTVLLVFILASLSANSFAQKRILDRAKKAIYQLDYQDARNELSYYLQKNPGDENNCYLLLLGRTYGDPESPYYDPDSAYKLLTLVVYYPSTFDPKIDVVVCKNYDACIDTVSKRSKQYVNVLLKRCLATKDRDVIKDFIKKYGDHEPQVILANKHLHQIEFERALKSDKILHYNTFIENYPGAEQVPQAIEAIERINYERVVRVNKVREYEIFLKKFPDSKYFENVVKHIEEARWEYCLNGNSVERYKEYLEHYPNSEHKAEADSIIEQLQWSQVVSRNEISYYRWFIRTYPSNKHIIEAQKSLFNLCWLRASSTDSMQILRQFIREYPNTVEANRALILVDELAKRESEEGKAEKMIEEESEIELRDE